MIFTDNICDELSRQIAKDALKAEKEGVGWEDYAKFRGVPLDEMEAMIALYILDTDDDEMIQLARLIISGDEESLI